MGIFSALLGNAGEVSKQDLKKDYGNLLIDQEEIELGFKLVRDLFIFTSKRLILIDKQGLTGSKIEYKSISYKSITRFSFLCGVIIKNNTGQFFETIVWLLSYFCIKQTTNAI